MCIFVYMVYASTSCYQILLLSSKGLRPSTLSQGPTPLWALMSQAKALMHACITVQVSPLGHIYIYIYMYMYIYIYGGVPFVL